MGEGLSGPRKGCGGFRFDSNSPERMGEGNKGAREGCGGIGICLFSFTGRVRVQQGGGLCDQIGRLGRASRGRERAMGGFRVDSNSPECVGEGSKGPKGVIRLGVWGGLLRAKRGLWVVGIPVLAICACW